MKVYKYCSDYRGSDANYCQKIKPYDNSGNYLDITSKCIYDIYIGCKRVPKECTDASTKQECNIISPYIEENKTKHCAYTEIISILIYLKICAMILILIVHILQVLLPALKLKNLVLKLIFSL